MQDGSAALLRMPSGIVWRLRAAGAEMGLGESIYLGSGEARRTQQVVLSGTTGPEGRHGALGDPPRAAQAIARAVPQDDQFLGRTGLGHHEWSRPRRLGHARVSRFLHLVANGCSDAWPRWSVVATGFAACLGTRALDPAAAPARRCSTGRTSARRIAAPTPRGGGIAVIGAIAARLGRARADRRLAPASLMAIALGRWRCWRRSHGSTICAVSAGGAAAAGPIRRGGDRACGCCRRAGVSRLAAPRARCDRRALSGSGSSICSTSWTGSTGSPAARRRRSASGCCCSPVSESARDPGIAALGAAIAAAALGFLVWNWAPARIFLGDVGSVPLGYVLGFLLLELAVRG